MYLLPCLFKIKMAGNQRMVDALLRQITLMKAELQTKQSNNEDRFEFKAMELRLAYENDTNQGARGGMGKAMGAEGTLQNFYAVFMRKYPKAWRRHVDRLVELQNVKNETREEEIKTAMAAKARADMAAKHKEAARRKLRRRISKSLYNGILTEFQLEAAKKLQTNVSQPRPAPPVVPVLQLPPRPNALLMGTITRAEKNRMLFQWRRARRAAQQQYRVARGINANDELVWKEAWKVWRRLAVQETHASLVLQEKELSERMGEIRKEAKTAYEAGHIADLENEAEEISAKIAYLAIDRESFSAAAVSRHAIREFKDRGYERAENWPTLNVELNALASVHFPTYKAAGADFDEEYEFDEDEEFDDENGGEPLQEVAVVAEASEHRVVEPDEVNAVAPVPEVSKEVDVEEHVNEVSKQTVHLIAADEIYIVEPQEALEQAVEPVAEVSADIHVVEEPEVFTETKNEQGVAAFADNYATSATDALAFDDELDDIDLAGLDSLFEDIGLGKVEDDEYSESSLDQLDRLVEEQGMAR